MTWPDYAILGILAISLLVGLLRGFIKEVFSLVVWVAAFVIAYRFADDVAGLMETSVTLPSARTAIGFIGLFILVLVIGGLVNYLLGRLVESTGLSGTDRLLGGVFGIFRGVAVVVAAILVMGFTPLPADPWWKESRLIKSFMPLVDWSVEFLPASASEHLDFEPEPESDDEKEKTESAEEESEPTSEEPAEE